MLYLGNQRNWVMSMMYNITNYYKGNNQSSKRTEDSYTQKNQEEKL